MQETRLQPTPVSLPGEPHGQRSLVGYSPQGHKDSDTTERLHSFFLSFLLSFLPSFLPACLLSFFPSFFPSFFLCSIKQIHPAIHLWSMCSTYEYYISIKSLGVYKCVCVYIPSEACCNISLYDTFALFSLPDKCVYTNTHTLYCLVTKSGPTLCDPMDCSTPGFPVFH